jgi:hemoglobin-like flavoprotein
MSLNIELLESSFTQIKEQETKFSAHFYTNLFADYPMVKPLLTKSDMVEQQKKLFKIIAINLNLVVKF